MILLPRLDTLEAERLAAQYQQKVPENLTSQSLDTLPEKVFFAASGGHPIDANRLRDLQKSVIEVAQSCGYSANSSAEQRSRFDEGISILFTQLPYLQSGDAARDDVWAFVATMLLPKVVHWRFGGSPERFLGGIRNAFQRLWLRGALFDRGIESTERWALLRSLTEDAMVQITERSSVSSDKRLALAIAEGWGRASDRFGRGAMEDIMRRAMIGIRLRNEIIALSCLADDELSNAVDSEFARAAVAGVVA